MKFWWRVREFFYCSVYEERLQFLIIISEYRLKLWLLLDVLRMFGNFLVDENAVLYLIHSIVRLIEMVKNWHRTSTFNLQYNKGFPVSTWWELYKLHFVLLFKMQQSNSAKSIRYSREPVPDNKSNFRLMTSLTVRMAQYIKGPPPPMFVLHWQIKDV